MKKYLKIYYKTIQYSTAQMTVFRASFFLFYGWILLDTLIKILFFSVIYHNVNDIGGWTYTDALYLVVFHGVMYDFAWTFYISSFERFIDTFIEGNFDFILTKPMHPLTYLTITGFSAPSFSGARFPLFLYVIIFFPLAWQTPNILLAIIIFIAGLIALHALFALVSALCFVIVDVGEVFDTMFNIIEGGRYPQNIYPAALRFIFTFFLPVLLIANTPILALKNMLSFNYAFIAIFIAVFLEIVAYKVWDLGIKHYTSASS